MYKKSVLISIFLTNFRNNTLFFSFFLFFNYLLQLFFFVYRPIFFTDSPHHSMGVK